MNGRSGGRTDEQTGGRIGRRTDRRVDGEWGEEVDGWTDGRTEDVMDGWTDERMDGRMDGQTVGRTNARTDGRTEMEREAGGQTGVQMCRWCTEKHVNPKQKDYNKYAIHSAHRVCPPLSYVMGHKFGPYDGPLCT